MSVDVERHRRECEARHWIRAGYVDAARVDELMQTIKERRGQAAADVLRAEMRVQWQRRAEWMTDGR